VEQRKTGVQEFCLETREGSPHPRGEKRQWTNMWLCIGQAVPHSHFCNLLYMVYKESPLCSWCSAFGQKSTESLLACWINLLPESFRALNLCLSPSAPFLGACPGFGGWCFHLLVASSASLTCQEHCFCQAPLDCVDPGEGASLPARQVGEFICTKEPGKVLEPTWEPHSLDW
jgi:hypothetical protein